MVLGRHWGGEIGTCIIVSQGNGATPQNLMFWKGLESKTIHGSCAVYYRPQGMFWDGTGAPFWNLDSSSENILPNNNQNPKHTNITSIQIKKHCHHNLLKSLVEWRFGYWDWQITVVLASHSFSTFSNPGKLTLIMQIYANNISS